MLPNRRPLNNISFVTIGAEQKIPKSFSITLIPSALVGPQQHHGPIVHRQCFSNFRVPKALFLTNKKPPEKAKERSSSRNYHFTFLRRRRFESFLFGSLYSWLVFLIFFFFSNNAALKDHSMNLRKKSKFLSNKNHKL